MRIPNRFKLIYTKNKFSYEYLFNQIGLFFTITYLEVFMYNNTLYTSGYNYTYKYSTTSKSFFYQIR